MRVEKLRLTHFGPFEDEEFEFPASGIAFLYGLNGDGKTTLTRAFIDLLFKIPSRNEARNDGWRFSQVPEITATVSGSEALGSLQATVVRRGGSLAELDGNKLDSNPFSEITKGLDKAEFAALYRIGHGELTEGGKRLSAQEGDLGAIVFGVGLGGSLDAKATLRNLIEEAGELFALEGKQQRGKRVTKDLSQLAEIRAQIQESSATPPEFAKNEQKIREAKERKATLERERDDCEAGQERLELLVKLLPDLVNRENLSKVIREFEAVRDHKPEIEAISLELTGIEVQVELLEGFNDTLTGNKLRELLESLGVAGVDDPDRALAEGQEILGLTDAELVERFRSSSAPGQLDTNLRQLNRKLTGGLEDLDYFPRQDGESDHDYVERFAGIQIPPQAEIATDRKEEKSLRKRISDREASREEAQRQLKAKETELETKSSHDKVPDRDALETTRKERQERWEEVRSVWVDGGEASIDPAELATTYEGTVEAADRVADALISQAEAVNIAKAIESLEERERELEALVEKEEQALENHLKACRERWNIGDVLSDFSPSSAEVMSEWLSEVDELRADRRKIFERSIELQAQVKQGSDDLQEAIEKKGDVARVVDKFIERVGKIAKTLESPVPDNALEAVKVANDLQAKLDEYENLMLEQSKLEKKILQAGQGKRPDDLEAEINGRDSTGLKQEADQLSRDAAAKQGEIDKLKDDLGKLEDWKREVSAHGSAEVKQMELDADALEDSIEEDIRRFLTLDVAVTELDRAMGSFGEKSAVEVCESAEAVFVELTAGRFERLETHFEEGNAWITVVRADTGEEVEIDRLSDGERDALYLAFRLATLMYQLRSLKEEDRPPVVLDDVLIGLDNNRVMAGLRAIHELSTLTQVVFLTHHEHMIELADETLSKDEGEWSLVRESGNWIAGEGVGSPA